MDISLKFLIIKLCNDNKYYRYLICLFLVFFSFLGTFQRFWDVAAKAMQKPRVTRCGGAEATAS